MRNINQIIPIETEILKWARKRLNLEIAEVAHKIGKKPSEVTNWENGKSLPSLAQLEELAYDVYKIPLATFFLSEVPQEPKINQQFRTIPDSEIDNLPPAFIISVKEGQYYQAVLRELFDNKNPVPNPLFKAIGRVENTSLQKVADTIREKLLISLEIQSSFKDSTEAFKYYRNALETSGIFVFQQTLKTICRGYSLYDSEFPIIVVNSSEISDTGKNFTLFHEFCHLLHATGGISNEFTYQSTNNIEVICNKLASLILVDTHELLDELKLKQIDPKQVSDLQLGIISKKFRVSKEVILRKLLDLDLTTQKFYLEKRKEWLSSLPLRKKSKGGNHFNIKLSKLGYNYSSIVLRNMYSGKISKYQASEYLNTKINYLPVIEKLVFK
ncbi:MAG TPA: hypothetical protein DDW27_18235 [Bacteroidales bacterium]|nr:hypothetical protein [Bacteroidales bacterium]